MKLLKPIPPECVVTLPYGPYPPALVARFGRSFHDGIDFALPHSENAYYIPIRAAADGTILHTGFNPHAGYFVVISHITPQNLALTVYLHLASQTVFRNSVVLAGDIIGHMGNTGDSTDIHLHFGAAIVTLSELRFFDPAQHFIN